MTEMAMITAHNEKRREIISFSTMLKTILIGLLFLSVGTILLNSEINALKPPKKFTAILGPDQQVIEDTNPFQWTQTDAHGTASFQANREMTEIHYKIYLDDIENVVGISIQKGNSGEIGSDDLVTIKETDVTNPEHYSTGGTIQGVITDDDVCPAHPLYDVDCTVFGLVYEFINHRAFLQIRTSDNTGMDNSGPGDLFIPGEIRGQIYPIPPSRIFESQINHEQQILDDVDDPTLWEHVVSHGTAQFIMNDDMTELTYTIELTNLENVIKIQILNDVVRQNTDFVLVEVQSYDPTEDFAPAGKITGIITNDDVCPSGHDDEAPILQCSVEGLVHEMINHRTYLQIKTDDGISPQNSGAGDLFTPGEIRGQIVPKAECINCIVNAENQILTIFKFETEDTPFLADTVTLLISPNPYAHNIGADFIEANSFGPTLTITDNDALDYDPTNGVIELVGVNPGVYSIMELKGPSGFLKTDTMYSSEEIFGEAYPHVQVTNLKIDFDDSTRPIAFDPPDIDEEILEKLEEFTATIGEIEITSNAQLPSSFVTLIENVFDEPSPQTVEFETTIDADWTIEETFENLGIPTYFSPSQTFESNQDIAFILPVFVAYNDEGQNIVMSPVIDEVTPSTDIVLRLDDIDVIETTGKSVNGVTLPLDIFAKDVGVSVEILEDIPSNIPEFTATIGEIEITSNAQLPSSFVTLIENVFDEPSPQTVEFETTIDADWTIEETFENLGIPTYFSPSQTFESNQDIAFILPVFVAYNDEGQNIVMSPVIDEVTPSTDIVLRLDDIDVIETTGKSVNGVTLPLDIFAKDVGVSVEILEDIPSNIPEFTDTSIETSLFLDFDFVGSIDFSNENIFSESPTLDFSLPTDDTFSCPDGVQVFLLNEDTLQWEAITSGPLRNEALDEMISSIATCGYTQSLPHFSSYLVGTGYFDGTSGGLSNPGGGGGSSGRSGGFGHDHSSHDHGDGVGTGSSSGGDGTVTKYGTNQDGILDADKLENTTKVDFVGSIDFSNENIFSESPTLDFSLPTDDTFSCPDGVQVFLLNEDTLQWEAITSGPLRNEALDEMISSIATCGYTQSLPHFSSYLVGTGYFDGTSGGLSNPGGGGGSSGRSGGFGHDHSSHDHGDGVGTGSSSGGDGTVTKYGTNQDGILDADKLENTTKVDFGFGGIVSDEFVFGTPAQFVAFTVIDPLSLDSELLSKEYDFGNAFEGTQMLIDVNEQKFPFKYDLDGEIKRVKIHEKEKYISFELENVIASEFTIRIPRSMLDANENNFQVLVTASPEKEVEYTIIESNENFVTLFVLLPNNAKDITIVGSNILEFDSDDKPAIQFEIEPSGYDVEFTVLDYLDTKYDFNEDFEGTSILVDVNDAMFPIQYYFDGEIYGITINEQSNSISFDLQNVVESDMTIRLLRNMLDADKNNFIALGTEDIPLTYDILDSASDSITLRLHLPENTQTLTLIGSKVVPEYGIFAVFILVIGISITLLISKKQTLAFNNL